ncbi:MAG: hypothetical protein ACOCVR_04390, partial [Myxococcota bacterium]
EADQRSHRYEVVWETLPDTPEGTYRLTARGKWNNGGEIEDYEVHSGPMEVLPCTDLRVEAKAVIDVTSPALVLLLRYPAEEARYSTLPGSGGWQVGRFRMIDPHFSAPFVPVWTCGAAEGSVLVSSGGEEQPVDLVFQEWETLPEQRSYEPGEGPGFRAELPGQGPWEITIDAGLLFDMHGNSNGGPVSLVLETP